MTMLVLRFEPGSLLKIPSISLNSPTEFPIWEDWLELGKKSRRHNATHHDTVMHNRKDHRFLKQLSTCTTQHCLSCSP